MGGNGKPMQINFGEVTVARHLRNLTAIFKTDMPSQNYLCYIYVSSLMQLMLIHVE